MVSLGGGGGGGCGNDRPLMIHKYIQSAGDGGDGDNSGGSDLKVSGMVMGFHGH